MKINKSVILFGILFIILLLVSETFAVEASTQDKTKKDEAEKEVKGETETQNKELDEVKEPDQYGRPRCHYGCCGGGGPYGCRRCCRPAEAKKEVKEETEAQNKEVDEVKEPDQYGRPRCNYGCCGGWGRYGCSRCCRPAEAANEEYEVDQYRGRGGYGRGRGGYNRGRGGRGGGRGGGYDAELVDEEYEVNGYGYGRGGGYGGGRGGYGGGYGGGHGGYGRGYGGGRGRGGGWGGGYDEEQN